MDLDSDIRKALGDKYEILSVIGKGGMATVYKAIQNSLNRPVALKIIHSNLVHDKEFIDRFLREAQVCGQLNHPNIVTVYDFGSVGSVHYMSMEFLEGVTLRDKVKSSGTLNESETIRYINPIAQALGYIHQIGFVHRDVKSSNIFITKEGRPVLMDFGIVYSKRIESLSQYGSVIGTPEYMSPEQASGKLKVDGRSDIYSLGVIMFECLTGRLPFKSDNHLTTLHQILHDYPPEIKLINPLVPKWLSNIVAACLVKDRTLRISDAKILANDLISKKFSGNLRIPNITDTEEQVTRRVETRNIRTENTWQRTKIENKSYNSGKDNRRLLVAIFMTLFVILVILIIQVIRP